MTKGKSMIGEEIAINDYLESNGIGSHGTKTLAKKLLRRNVTLAKLILKDIGSTLTKLPLIKSADPIAKYHGWVQGDMVRVYRRVYVMQTMIKDTIFYHAVVD